MFTGIIETLGTIVAIEKNGICTDFVIKSNIANQLKIDQSVAHNGACLTVVEINGDEHRVTVIPESIAKTNIGDWKINQKVNLERCTQVGSRLDGHIVAGHVDQTALCTKRVNLENSWIFTFRYTPSSQALIVEKGSITIDGTSLTVFDVVADLFSVAIIPYTFEHTTMHQVEEGARVNIEFDLIGKYVAKMLQIQKTS
jgi:riboflavin synthase